MQCSDQETKGLSREEFEQLSGFIRAHSGIKMPLAKKVMLESRLQKRLRALGMASFREYCGLLFHSPDGADELPHMLDAVTTNKTDFFREPSHFTFLTETILPEVLADCRRRDGKRCAFWSAGCSTGEEPYTLAIVLSEFAALHPFFRFTILATDLSTKALEKARLGIYDQNQTAMIPPALLRKYFMRSKDRTRGLVCVTPELGNLVQFQRLNLMDEYAVSSEDAMEVIFCRNVLIYFDRETQYTLLLRLCRYLKTGGHLFLGHSETVHGFDLPLVRISSTVYQKVPEGTISEE